MTASFSVFGFARSRLVDWRRGLWLAVITTLSAPIGAYLAQFVDQSILWVVYFITVFFLTYRLLRPILEKPADENVMVAYLLAVPISILSGLLGVGAGFLLVPALILVGFDAKKAAGINAVAVTPSSFSYLIPHIGTAQLSWNLVFPLLLVGAIGSFLGARMTSLYVPVVHIRRLFAVLIVVTALIKLWTLL